MCGQRRDHTKKKKTLKWMSDMTRLHHQRWPCISPSCPNLCALHAFQQLLVTALFAFFTAVNHFNEPLSTETKLYLNGSKRSWFVICDWWISICFVCFYVSRFVACDRNYDWRQRKTQLWRRLLNFRVRMFVKSAVTDLGDNSAIHLTVFWNLPFFVLSYFQVSLSR